MYWDVQDVQDCAICERVQQRASVQKRAKVEERATAQETCKRANHPMHGPVRTCPGSRHTDQSRDCWVDFRHLIHLSFEVSQRAEIDHTWDGQARPL